VWWAVVAASSAVAAAVAYLYSRRGHGPLDVSTSVIGYPIFANFNYLVYGYRYQAVAIVFPVVLIVSAYLGHALLRVGPARNPSSLAWFEQGDGVPARFDSLRGPGRAAVIGGVLGLELSVLWEPDKGVAAAVMAAGAGVAFLSAWIVDRLRFNGARRVPPRAAFVIVGAVVSVFGLWCFSRVTRVTVVETGAIVKYPWLPWWVALLASGAAAFALWIASRRLTLDEVEAKAVWFIAPIVVLFAFFAMVSSGLGILDFFHFGEALGGANLTFSRGYFPWRDLYFIHGLMKDAMLPAIGLAVIDKSVWGMVSGRELLENAAFWIGNYFLLRALLRNRSLLAFVITLVAAATAYQPLTGLLAIGVGRFILQGYLLALFTVYLVKRTWGWAIAFGLLLVVQAIVTPESLYTVVCCGFVLVAYDLAHPEGRRWFANRFLMTRRVALVGLVGGAAFVGWLAVNGALGAYIGYFQTFAKDHALTGAIPVTLPSSWLFRFEMYVLPISVVLGLLYCGWRLIGRRNLVDEEWAALAALLFAGIYYTKFLSRADWHLADSWSMAIPVMLYMAVRLLDAAAVACSRAASRLSAAWRSDAALRTGLRLGSLGVALLVFGAYNANIIVSRLTSVKSRLAVSTQYPVVSPRYGYGSTPPQIATLSAALASVRGAQTSVFDFTNSPAIFSFFFDKPSPTRFFHVSMAIQLEAQKQLVDELAATQPDVVAYNSGKGGLPAWDAFDVPEGDRSSAIYSEVRHYAVSNYILDNYTPYIVADGYSLFVRNGLTPDRDLRARDDAALVGPPPPCEWGFSPAFLAPAGRSRLSESPSVASSATVAASRSINEFDTMLIRPKGQWNAGLIEIRPGAPDAPPISFYARPGTTDQLRIFVGACRQWHVDATTFSFTGGGGDAVGSVELQQTLPEGNAKR
jgi:hypothetical protein